MATSVSYRAKGTDFARYVIARALSGDNDDAAVEIASRRWGATSEAAKFCAKAATSAATSADGTWAGPLVVDGPAAEFFAAVAQVSIIGRLAGLRRIPFHTRALTPSTGLAAGFVGQGKAAPVIAGEFVKTSLARLKVAGITVLTEELMAAATPSAEAVIRGDLIRAVAEALDVALTDPANAGSAGVSPASVTNGLTPITATASPTADLKALVADFAGDLAAAYFVLRPDLAAGLAGATFPNVGARGGDLLGVPCITSRSAPSGAIILVDPTGIAAADEPGEVNVSREASLEMATDPAGASDTPTAANLVSLWQTHAAGVRIAQFANWETVRPGSVSLITGAGYGDAP